MSHLGYAEGYEPSAPPIPRQHGGEFGADFPGSRDQQEGSSATGANHYDSWGGAAGGHPPYKTVGQHLLEVFRDAFLRPSHTTARVDLVRPHRRKEGAPAGSASGQGGWRGPAPYYGHPSGNSQSAPSGAYYGREGSGFEGEPPPDSGSGQTGWAAGLQRLSSIEGRGARLKLMQVWDFPDEDGRPSMPWGINMGVGANYDVDRSELQPKWRIRGKHAALHLLPHPELELRGKWSLGISDIAIDLRYRVPLASAQRFWDGDSGARLLLNLFHPFGTGVHLSPGGLEFDERVWQVGKHTYLRAAATVEFPRRIPFDNERVRIQMHRLGLKTRLT